MTAEREALAGALLGVTGPTMTLREAAEYGNLTAITAEEEEWADEWAESLLVLLDAAGFRLAAIERNDAA